MSESVPRHFALLPVLNAGRTDIADYKFACGATLSCGATQPVMEAIGELSRCDHVSRNEVLHFTLARAWMWIGSDEAPDEIDGPRNVFAVCNELARRLWTLRWLIDLAGAGENDYWRYGNAMHCAGPYVISRDLQVQCQPPRRHFVFSPPSYTQRMATWSEERLRAADVMKQRCDRYGGDVIPRLALANNLRIALTRYDAPNVAVRFALAVSAMETLFIEPNDPHRWHVWSPPVQERIREVCPGIDGIDNDFFEAARIKRNDAVHRGGRDAQGTPIKFIDVQAKFEEILRASLRWGLLSQDEIADPFDRDEWPSLSRSNLDLCRDLNHSLYVEPSNE